MVGAGSGEMSVLPLTALPTGVASVVADPASTLGGVALASQQTWALHPRMPRRPTSPQDV